MGQTEATVNDTGVEVIYVGVAGVDHVQVETDTNCSNGVCFEFNEQPANGADIMPGLACSGINPTLCPHRPVLRFGLDSGNDRADASTLVGQAVAVTLMFGGSGNDTLIGGSLDDTLLGEADNDILRPGADGGAAAGGAGNDTIELANPFGDVVISGGDGTDSLEFTDNNARTLSLDGLSNDPSAPTSIRTSKT